jgi:DNA polymerase-3 subunit alpha
MYIIFDTETTGLPKRWKAPLTDSENWPRCIQIAWQVHADSGELLSHEDYLIQPDGYTVPYDAEQIHGISTALAEQQGRPLAEVLALVSTALAHADYVGGHNVTFDLNIMGAEFLRLGDHNPLEQAQVIDTCTEETAQLCQLPGGRGGKFNLPTLPELYIHLFGTGFGEAHNATADVEATTRCFLELLRKGQLHPPVLEGKSEQLRVLQEAQTSTIEGIGLKHVNLKKASQKLIQKQEPEPIKPISTSLSAELDAAPFVHLHNHSQFSVLQATSKMSQMVSVAAENQMPAIAITDHANLMGAFHFIKAVGNHNKDAVEEAQIKPIVGCEFYVCEDHKDKARRDDGYQIVFLAKNKKGYHNLAKMSSIAYVDGFYYVPRIDREIVEKYMDDLIVLTGNLYGEVPSKILNIGNRQAEEALQWWHKKFGDDLYVELMRHGQEDEKRANDVLVSLARQYQIPLIASNNT